LQQSNSELRLLDAQAESLVAAFEQIADASATGKRPTNG